MKAVKFVAMIGLIISALFSGSVSQAESVDERPLLDFLNQHVRTLDHSVYMWHWFNSRGRNPLWASHFASDDAATWYHFDYMANIYFQNFCATDGTPNPPDCNGQAVNFGAGNMHGPGLYVLADPVGTASYGGGTGWAVLQIRLPVGFRYMSFDDYEPLSQDAKTVLDAMGCKGMSYISDVINAWQSKGYRGSQCVLEMRRVLKDEIKVDGISYRYGAATLAFCETSSGAKENHGDAFVLTSSRLMNSQDIRIFNSQTSDALEDRTRLESLFYLASFNSVLQAMSSLPGYPDYKVRSSWQNCNYDTKGVYKCGYTVSICNADNSDCKQVPAPDDLDLTQIKMSTQSAPGNQSNVYGSLLWSDLEGQALPGDLKTWVQEHLFGCK